MLFQFECQLQFDHKLIIMRCMLTCTKRLLQRTFVNLLVLLFSPNSAILQRLEPFDIVTPKIFQNKHVPMHMIGILNHMLTDVYMYASFLLGIAGGGHYQRYGNGANTLCLPHNPDPAPSDFPTHFQSDNKLMSSFIYGAEYQYTYRNVAVDDDVPCAVCDVARASSVIMIPAKVTCPAVWMKEYSGVLTATCQMDSWFAREYLCVDENAEYLSEGTRQQNYDGSLFFPVQAVCGSLPCPPYKSSQLISCVVCSK